MAEIEVKGYFQELNPKKRRKMLKNMAAENPGAEQIRVMQELYAKRYETTSNGELLDRFMFILMDLQELGKHVPFIKAVGRKRLKKNLDAFGFQVYKEDGERALLLQEIQNAAARYLDTCLADDYGKLFGAIKPSASRRQSRIEGDICGMTDLLVKAFYEDADEELKKDLTSYCDAVKAIYTDFDKVNFRSDEDDDEDDE